MGIYYYRPIVPAQGFGSGAVRGLMGGGISCVSYDELYRQETRASISTVVTKADRAVA